MQFGKNGFTLFGWLGVTMVLISATTAEAQDTNFTGASSNFSDPNAWDAGVPDATLNAVFTNKTGTVNLDADSIARSIQQTGGDLTIVGLVVPHTLTSIEDSIVHSGSMTWGGQGTVYTSAADFIVGTAGTASLTINSGVLVENRSGILGESSGTIGNAVVTGSGTQWNNSSNLRIGDSGEGTMLIQDGGLVNSANARLGFSSSGIGRATITGNGSRWNAGSLDIGSGGNGELTIVNGGVVVGGGFIGRFGTGLATVSGTGSRWEGGGNQMKIGWGGNSDGSLTISNGGFANGSSGFIADANGSTGLVTVTGSGSLWELSQNVNVGFRGDGTLSINSGGQVIVDNTRLATGTSNGIANVTVDGAGSLLNNRFGMVVGSSGVANLDINNGGLVRVASQATTVGVGSSISLGGGRLEFGRTDFSGSYSRINGSSGSLAGDVLVVGDQTVSALNDLSKANLNTQEVLHGNNNLITGSGVSTHGLSNFSSGELRTNAGETARFGGIGSSNRGLISNQGGSILFDNDLVNGTAAGGAGEISGNGQFQFGGGLVNHDDIFFGGGNTIVDGTVTNAASGRIETSGSSTTTFNDRVVHNGARIETESGSTTVFAGQYSGAGDFTGTGDVFFEDQINLGNSAAVVDFAGDVFLEADSQLLIELGGTEIEEFDRFDVAGDMSLNGLLELDLIDGFIPTDNDIFLFVNIDGFATGQFIGLSEGDLVSTLGGFDFTISYALGDGNDVGLFASTSAVPEPGTLGALGILGLGLLFRRRRAVNSN